MDNIENTFFTFEQILSGESSLPSDFVCHVHGGIELIMKGDLFNITIEQLSENYAANGFSAFTMVDGDFILFIKDAGTLHVVRDRHGVGQQFFYTDKSFGFNLLAFTGIDGFECKPDVSALMTFLSIGYIPSPMTSIKGVSKLNPGFALTYSNHQITTLDLFDFKSYMSKAASSILTESEAVRKYEELHKKAISSRISNVSKVGLLLSGGYDSGGNISALRDLYQGDVVTYSIGFKDNPWTELPLARILSDRYHTRHYEYEIDGSEIMNLPRIIRETGDPFQEGGLLVNYTAMQLVQQSGEKPGIILGGDGNDQHFGTSGKELALNRKLKSKGLQSIQKWYDWLGDQLTIFDKDNIFFRTQFHNRKILHILQSDIFGFSLRKLNKMSRAGLKLKKPDYLKHHPEQFADFKDFFLSRNYNIDIKQVINEVILFKSSRMATLFGGKISFPYMSTDLYHFLNEMPVAYKFKGNQDELASGKGVSKYLHKTYLHPKLPTEITERKKQGGFAPLPIFLKNDEQRKKLFGFIRKSDAVNSLFHQKEIGKLLDQYETIVASKPYWFWFQQVKANQIINVLTMAVWWEMFINRKTDVQSINELIEKG